MSDLTPEQNEKMQALNKLAEKRGKILGFKLGGMILFVAVATLILNQLFVQSNLFVVLSNLSGGFLVLLNTKQNMEFEIATLEKETRKIMGLE